MQAYPISINVTMLGDAVIILIVIF